MVNKAQEFNKAEHQLITYGQVMEDLNYIAKTAGDDTAHFDIKLKDVNGKSVCGFVFNGIATGLKLSQLLGKLGIRCTHHYPEQTPYKGEIHIHPEYASMAKELFANWTSWVVVEKRITGNMEIDAKWSRVVAERVNSK